MNYPTRSTSARRLLSPRVAPTRDASAERRRGRRNPGSSRSGRIRGCTARNVEIPSEPRGYAARGVPRITLRSRATLEPAAANSSFEGNEGSVRKRATDACVAMPDQTERSRSLGGGRGRSRAAGRRGRPGGIGVTGVHTVNLRLYSKYCH